MGRIDEMSAPDTTSPSESPSPRKDPCWQFVEHDLLVFERALGPSGPFRMLVSRIALCTQRQCSCREVTMRAIGLDSGTELSGAPLPLEPLRAMLDSPHAMQARIDMDLGLVEADNYEGRSPLGGEWVEWLQSRVDGDLLDVLHERWLRAKGWRQRTPEEVKWPASAAGQLFGWRETHPEERRDLFLDEGIVFMADDLYCVNPACACSEIILDFAELFERDRARSIGHIRVALPDLQVIEWKSPQENRAIVERLWAAFRQRHLHAAERLGTRKQRMSELGRARLDAGAPMKPLKVGTARIGRNDPCPCGSGQKYKRCCAT
jgi:hypothetical protein